MTHTSLRFIVSAAIITLSATFSWAQDGTAQRQARSFISKGNKEFAQKRYAEAETSYRKALEADPNSEAAKYNLASVLIRQSNGMPAKEDDKNNPITKAQELLQSVAKETKNPALASKAYYNLGNIAYNGEQYDQSVEMYKNALRRTPDDDEARDNLRLAQKKLEQQQKNNDKNKGGNNDQNKDQNDKDQQQKDQNQNKDKQDQNQNKQQQQQPQPSMSEQNMDQILKAMQDKENDTQKKLNELKRKKDNEQGANAGSRKNW